MKYNESLRILEENNYILSRFRINLEPTKNSNVFLTLFDIKVFHLTRPETI